MSSDFSSNSSSRHVNFENADVSDNGDNSSVPCADVDAPVALRISKRNCGPSTRYGQSISHT